MKPFKLFLIVFILIVGCSKKNKTTLIKEGEEVFNRQQCNLCHLPKTKSFAKSIVDIRTIYNKNQASIARYLKGEAPPIVDSTKGSVVIMKKVKESLENLPEKDFKALIDYIEHIEKQEEK